MEAKGWQLLLQMRIVRAFHNLNTEVGDIAFDYFGTNRFHNTNLEEYPQ